MSENAEAWLAHQELYNRVVNNIKEGAASVEWVLERSVLEGRRKRLFFSERQTRARAEIWFMAPEKDERFFRSGSGFILGYRHLPRSDSAARLIDKIFVLLETMARIGWLGNILRDETGGSRSRSPLVFNGKNSFDLRLTQDCNEKCAYCFIDKKSTANLARDKTHAMKLLFEGKQKGATRVEITGGEPTLVPGFREVLKEAQHLGYQKIVLQTNATMLDETTIEELASLESLLLFVSLPGHNADIVGRITQRPQLFETKLEVLHRALDAGLQLTVNHVVCRQNMPYLDSFVEWIETQFVPGLQEVVFSFAIPLGSAWSSGKNTVPSYSEAAPLIVESLRLAREKGLNAHLANACGVPLCIDERLSSYPEPEIDLNADGEMKSSDHVKSVKCKSCRFHSHCLGIPKRYLQLYGTGEFSRLLSRDGA